jgi:exo-rhamnogalacturonan lyase-like protein
MSLGRSLTSAGVMAELEAREVSLWRHSRGIARGPQPATFGIPFPPGWLTADQPLALTDEAGVQLPLQVRPLTKWQDGSIQWLLVDTIFPDVDKGSTRFALKHAREKQRSQTMDVKKEARGLELSTGPVVFELSSGAWPPLRHVKVRGHSLLDQSQTTTYFADARGKVIEPRMDCMTVEESGPVRCTIRWDGRIPGVKGTRIAARCCFFAGTGLVRMRFMLRNENRARHKNGFWDLGDPGSILFRDLSIQLGIRDLRQTIWRTEPAQSPRVSDRIEIYQDSSGGANWQSVNHVNAQGCVPCRFRGYRISGTSMEEYGLHALPVITLRGTAGSLTAAFPQFWQNFPKAIEANANVLRIRLFPQQTGELFELQGGEQKTHTIWLNFGEPHTPDATLDWVHGPSQIVGEPEWYTSSGALPYFYHVGDSSARLDAWLRECLEGTRNVFVRNEQVDEFGWRHFGDIFADHEADPKYCHGSEPITSHYNNQYDFLDGTIMNYLRTGDARWWELAVPLAQHIIDIDLYHTQKDRSVYNGGLFWFTDHYLPARTCTHRSYAKVNYRSGDKTAGGGPSSNHLFTTGLTHYYLLTGDPQALEAVKTLADWVEAMDDGEKNPLGLLDSNPTGLASFTGTFDYHGPGRGAGNSVNALLDAWILTREPRYLRKAEELIRRCIHPADDIDGRNLKDVEKRWSYTVFLKSLAKYLQVRQQNGGADFMVAYARESLVGYAKWMLANEIPFFDRSADLEYPTEAWAGQEFRKANVMRLAAMYCRGPLREGLLSRAEQLADRAWDDLRRFESRTSTRAMALCMGEGILDALARSRELPFHIDESNYDFGKPSSFIPQKQRVAKLLKSPHGFFCLIRRLMHPRNWKFLLMPWR